MVISSFNFFSGQSGEGVVAWSSLTLSHMLTSQSMVMSGAEGSKWQTDILSFLVLHSCFRVTKPCSQLKHVSSMANSFYFICLYMNKRVKTQNRIHK